MLCTICTASCFLSLELSSFPVPHHLRLKLLRLPGDAITALFWPFWPVELAFSVPACHLSGS